MTDLTTLDAWRALTQHHAALAETHMRALFEADPERFARFSLQADGLLLDVSKHRITGETLDLLRALAVERGLEDWRRRLFAGERINTTEDRAVLHVALRDRGAEADYRVDGEPVSGMVRDSLAAMRAFTEAVHEGRIQGATGRNFTDVVNIGIGGSDLGPLMVCEALAAFGHPGLRVQFVSNVDPAHLTRALRDADPETTLFVVASKTFTTQETMLNAHAARRWLIEGLGSEAAARGHVVGVTASPERAEAFGVAETFGFWDWVGGRFSLWSAIGLPIALAVGFDNFEALLDGACAMDRHFRDAPPERNLPLTLALLGVWYRDFFGAESHAVLPYAQALHRLPAYLQQAEMESNGKSVGRDGDPVGAATCPIVWGEAGTNGQHAFYQLLHQGSSLVPADFIVFAEATERDRAGDAGDERQNALVANALAQTAAFMAGRTLEEARAEVRAEGVEAADVERQAAHKVFPGNRPSSTLLIDRLSPYRLGQIIALYEHKIFCQGVIWGLNSYDQPGVELGKQLAAGILPALHGKAESQVRDGSTLALLAAVDGLRSSAAE